MPVHYEERGGIALIIDRRSRPVQPFSPMKYIGP